MNIHNALLEIARLAHWEIIAAGPAANVTGHAVTLPRRPSTLRVWGPRDSIERTRRPQY